MCSGSWALLMLISRRDDFGVEGGTARRDALQGVEEVVDVEHAVLEQVAEGSRADEVDRVRGLDVLGEQQDPQLGIGGTQEHGGARAVVGVVGRHPDVDDGEVGSLVPYGVQQVWWRLAPGPRSRARRR